MSSFPVNASYSPFLPGQLQPCPERNRIDKKAAVLRHIADSERLIKVLPASQLDVRPRPEMLSTGISALDALTGGIPRGCLTGFYGAASSGKTSVLLTTIATATRREEACVLIDASDSFDPSSGAAAGLHFQKLLWVRCGVFPPRAEACVEQSREDSATQRSVTQRSAAKNKNSELRLEQVLKAADLVLQSGGFGLIALDLAGIPDKFVRRIPLASWFRFQRAVEHTKTAFLVISEFPCAQTCAALAIKLSAVCHPSFFQSEKPAHAQILEDMEIQAEVERSRLERKPQRSVATAFKAQTIRAG